jgi:PAS domain S-box-containing protein
MNHSKLLRAASPPPDPLAELQQILPHLHEIIYALDAAGASTLAGPVEFIGGPVEDLIGVPPEKISGQPGAWLDLIHPEDRAEMQRSTLVILDRRKPVIREYRLRDRTSGEVRWVLDRGVPRLDDQGKVIRILGILTDITARRQVFSDLYDANKLLQVILDHTYLMLAYLDRDLNFLSVNRAYASADQHDPDYFVGKNHFDLFPNPENEAIFRNVVKTGEPHYAIAKPFEYTANPERGVSYWDWVLVPVKDQGKVVGVVLTLLNVTAHVQTEERLGYSEALLKQAQQIARIGSWTFDIQTGKLDWSDEMYRIYGRTRDSAQVDLSIDLALSWTHPDDLVSVQADFARVQRSNDPPAPFEFRILRPDGDVRTVLIESVIDHSENGRPHRLIGVMQDITERRQLEQALRERTLLLEEANAELKHLSALKDEFVSNVSHELRTPIANLELRQRLLRQHPERIETHLPVLMRETARLAHTIESLLRLSRLDQNRIEIHLQLTDLNALLAEYSADLSELARDKSIRLTFTPGKNLPHILADPAMITQTLTTLIDNAFNYVPALGSITIKTGVKKNQEVWFSVANSGPPIPPEEREKIFERFFRGSINAQRHVPGTGLGLAIARELVTRQGGAITAGGDAGAVFTVSLPLIAPDREVLHSQGVLNQ